MRYPFSITFDLEILAKSYEEAQKTAVKYLENVKLSNNPECPEVILDQLDVVDYQVCDADDYDECMPYYTQEIRVKFNEVYRKECEAGTPWQDAFQKAIDAVKEGDYEPAFVGWFMGYIGAKDETIRCCAKCGRPMFEGYLFGDDDYACSKECLREFFDSEEEMEEALSHAEENNCPVYWTEWEKKGIFKNI